MYFRYIVLNIKQVLQYKTDFIIGAFPHLFGQVLSIIFYRLVLDTVLEIEGWKYYEMLFIYGLSLLVFGMYLLIFGNLRNLKSYLFNGEFEIMCLRPISLVKHVMIMSFQSEAIEQIAVGAIIILTSIVKLNIRINLGKLVLLVYFVIAGTMILGAFALISSSVLLLTNGMFMPIVVLPALKEFTKYPLSLFGSLIQCLFTWIIPIGFVSYYPSLFFLRYHTRYIVFSGFLSIIFWAIGIWLFRYGRRQYNGVSA